MLFDLLDQYDRRHLLHGKVGFDARECDVLCRYYHRAPRVSTLIAVMLVLLGRADARGAEVAAHLALRDPTSADLWDLAELWQEPTLHGPLTRQVPWFAAYFQRPDRPAMYQHIGELIQHGEMTTAQLVNFGDTPVLRKLTDQLVATGDAMLGQLPSDWLAQRMFAYVETKNDTLLRCSLEHVPDARWSDAWLQALLAAKGPPDPERVAFYRELPVGRLWCLRQRLFAPFLSDDHLPAEIRRFWEAWLHHVGNLEAEGVGWWITLGRLRIFQTPVASHLYFNDRQAAAEVVVVDGAWRGYMERVVRQRVHGH